MMLFKLVNVRDNVDLYCKL